MLQGARPRSHQSLYLVPGPRGPFRSLSVINLLPLHPGEALLLCLHPRVFQRQLGSVSRASPVCPCVCLPVIISLFWSVS